MDYRNILIVKMSAIGDVIHALPVAQALKEHYPASKITWMVEKAASDLLTMNPYIDEIILFDKPKYKSLAGLIKHGPELAKLLKSYHFDFVLDLQGLFKSAAIAWLSGAPSKIGYCNMRELSWLVSKPVCGANKDGHVIERYLDVARYLGCNVTEPQFGLRPDERDKEEAMRILSSAGLNIASPYIVMAPGTNWLSKCWPAENYAALADALAQKYKESIVLIGGAQDQERAEIIQAGSKADIINLIGKTTLKQLTCILQKSKLFIGGDTGPMHLAVAMGTTAMALFGPSDADRNGPFGSRNIIIRKKLACSPCFKRTCADLQCMEQITVDDILAVIESRRLLTDY